MILIVTIFILVTGRVYLLLQRSMVRTMFGLRLSSHAINFILFTTDVPGWRTELTTDGTSTITVADPFPQASVLTAVVIILTTSILMLAMTIIGRNDSMLCHPETGETRRA